MALLLDLYFFRNPGPAVGSEKDCHVLLKEPIVQLLKVLFYLYLHSRQRG